MRSKSPNAKRWHPPSPEGKDPPTATLAVMYGPLNGVRAALVACAVLAAIAAGALGYWTAALVLLAGVAVHGAGWFYLAAKAKADPSR